MNDKDTVVVPPSELTVKCDACGESLRLEDSRIDEDGFTGCRPCFPVSNYPRDADRFMEGPCFMPARAALKPSTDKGGVE